MSQGSRRRRRPMGEINVVPYIDVMLVLLIIFMVTAPLLTQGVNVDLPDADAPPINVTQEANREPLVVSIDRAGVRYLNRGDTPESPVSDAVLREQLSLELAAAPGIQVFIKADQQVAYGEIVSTMLVLQTAGASRVGFLTEPGTREPRQP
jgi:biopolymer transport protein TolR